MLRQRAGASGHRHHVAAGILPAVEGGILPPGGAPRACGTAIPPGKMPGSTAGRMPAATAQVGGSVQMRPQRVRRERVPHLSARTFLKELHDNGRRRGGKRMSARMDVSHHRRAVLRCIQRAILVRRLALGVAAVEPADGFDGLLLPPELDRIMDIQTAIPVVGSRSSSMPQAPRFFLHFLQFGC